ncbi:30S ribosomal protein S5 [Patescibacteria group bacterium]|nr:30S ribosomal protein S5 [Patescibacteria group bacterium]MBU4023114.1 30S ribosomal protein S5 [Patescibacteria group bacterium]MBU4078448.1 30S ribosomal protein S5 [Patescibacteria group bacterium]
MVKTTRERKQDNKFDKPKDEYESHLLALDRVVRVTAGGKQLRFRAVVVVGDQNGKVGIGVAKGLDVAQAVEKATRRAKKDVIIVAIKNGTVPYEITAKFGSARVLLRPQRPGRGLVAGGTVRVICSLAGIKNVSSKILGGSRNKLNNARATMRALTELRA